MHINSAKELGAFVKTIRRSYGLTQSQLAGACGTGIRFIVDLEKGKPTCALDKALRVVMMLGIKLEAKEPLRKESK